MRVNYYRRVLAAYAGGGRSQLSFWHERPELNESAFNAGPDGPYYMTFADKARYAGPFDADGIPLLDYRGALGRQINPIAAAQYGLAWWNEWKRTGEPAARARALHLADWLAAHLENGCWLHHFDWDYFRPLRAPWRSGLAQGQGLSLLTRALAATGAPRYKAAAAAAFEALAAPVADGGCLHVDEAGDVWIEEYITDPPTHIVNGMIWALWGVRDWAGSGGGAPAQALWERGVATLRLNLARFDLGYWSRYDLAPVRLPNPASAFYHRLHIVQLAVLARLAGAPVFEETRARWAAYAARPWNRRRAFAAKCLFKAVYY